MRIASSNMLSREANHEPPMMEDQVRETKRGTINGSTVITQIKDEYTTGGLVVNTKDSNNRHANLVISSEVKRSLSSFRTMTNECKTTDAKGRMESCNDNE